MKKILIILMLFGFVIAPCSSVLADESNGVDIQTKISVNEDKTVDVTIPTSLASTKTHVTIPCELSNPIVQYNGTTIYSNNINGEVKFTATNAGTYKIIENNSTGGGSGYKAPKTCID